MFLATLGLAALALVQQTESPVVWAFLGVSIGHLFGKNAIYNLGGPSHMQETRRKVLSAPPFSCVPWILDRGSDVF